MKFSIKKEILLEALNKVSKAISTKNVIPVLAGIKFHLTKKKLTLTASDNDITIETSIPCDNENNLIRLAKKKTKIKGIVKNDKSLKNLEIEIMETEKVVKVNNKRIYCLADYISNLNIVLFTPDDLELIKGSPSIRRNLLNMELSQLSSLYLNTYNQYNKILRTRNEYPDLHTLINDFSFLNQVH